MIHILIVEEHEQVRKALTARLHNHNDLCVVRSLGCGAEAIEYAHTYQPEVVLMEIKTSEGMRTLRALRKALPEGAIIVLTSYLDSREEAEVLDLGASAYVLKSLNTAALVEQIHNSARAHPLT
jgi:two-component system vancomycin resistance associated response regulator VraR